MKNYKNIYIMLLLLLITTGCSIALNMSYDPAYIEKRSTITSNPKFDKIKTILVLPYSDKRPNGNPSAVYKNIKLSDQTLAEYLHESIIKDLKMMGFNVVATDQEKFFNDVTDLKKYVKPDINLVLCVEVNECTSDYIMHMTSTEPYSIFDFNITIMDNQKKEIVYKDRLYKKIMGEETTSSTFKYMVEKLLNDDLTIINLDIAELLVNNF